MFDEERLVNKRRCHHIGKNAMKRCIREVSSRLPAIAQHRLVGAEAESIFPLSPSTLSKAAIWMSGSREPDSDDAEYDT